MFLRTLGVGLADLLWPPVCAICAEPLRGREPWFRGRGGRPLLHERCFDALRLGDRIALEFGERTTGIPVRAACDDCPEFFSLLHAAKYGGDLSLMDFMGVRLAERIAGAGSARVVPMPDEPGRLAARGASPVGVLAASFARAAGWSVEDRLLRRRRGGVSQSTITDDRQRVRNVAGRFRCGDLARIGRGDRLVLVEDQVTSGATIAEALTILAARGNPLCVLAIARSARAPRRVHLDGPRGRS